MVNWIYELEWNCDGNLLFYIQNEGEGIALLWQCECQHSAAIYVLNHSFLYKWGNKAKEKRNELNEFVKKFMEDREIPDENFNICYDKNVCKYYEDFRLEQKPFDLLEYLYNMYVHLVKWNFYAVLIKFRLVFFKKCKSCIPVIFCLYPRSCLKCHTTFIKALYYNLHFLILKD